MICKLRPALIFLSLCCGQLILLPTASSCSKSDIGFWPEPASYQRTWQAFKKHRKTGLNQIHQSPHQFQWHKKSRLAGKFLKNRHFQKHKGETYPDKGVQIGLLIFFFLLLALTCFGLVIWAVGGFLLDWPLMGVLVSIGALAAAYFAIKTLIRLFKTIKSVG